MGQNACFRDLTLRAHGFGFTCSRAGCRGFSGCLYEVLEREQKNLVEGRRALGSRLELLHGSLALRRN